MGLNKRILANNNSGAIPLFVWAIVVIGGVVVTGIGVYQFTQKPDITYNISDTGFSLAGVDISWFLIIAVVGGILILFMFLGRGKKSEPEVRYIESIRRD